MSRSHQLEVQVTARVGTLLLDVAFELGAQTLVVVGPNGAGKSSLLSIVLGLIPPTSGRISVGGNLLLDTRANIALPIERRHLGYLPQNYALFPHLSVRQNIAFALRAARAKDQHIATTIEKLLLELGLKGSADRSVRTLSGGEQQRVALARALSTKPRALLLDEPLAALDVHARSSVRTFLSSYLGSLSLPTILVTHDAEDARVLGRWIAVLEQGRFTQTGTWAELSARPSTRFVEEFVMSAQSSNASPD